ncbi:phage tail protein [Paraburkholderia bonniea]|uniref:phage tail protein n=1 Tax=Paraburkholderia bonniea TaxID=2152891 RepID=UPI001292AC0A|nr:phage tail protein [Paraburkholderia bonniea]
MPGFLITVTDAGRAALVAAGNSGTNAHCVLEIGLSTAPFNADKSLVALPDEKKRINTFAGENVAADTIHITLQDETADQYTLFGFGLYLENGVLFAVYSQAAPIMEKSPAAILLLSADIQLTTIDASALTFGETSFTNPPATTEWRGVIEIATQDETDAGQDSSRALTPKTAAQRYAALPGARFTGTVGMPELLVGKSESDGKNALQVAGSVRIDYDLTIRREGGEGRIYIGENDGYFYANAGGAGWYSSLGAFQYFADSKEFKVNANPVWHTGNLTPLDRNRGGSIYGDVRMEVGKRLFVAEGSAASPSLVFDRADSPDTGLWHDGKGTIGVACDGTSVARFTSEKTCFDIPVQGPTPPENDRSERFATTAWVRSVMSMETIGQIVLEPRTSARAGYIKANGALINRADYPALWAYAQGSGALYTESDWASEFSGGFSHGDGVTTFRIPDLRGEHLRGWDDSRGLDPQRRIGTRQDSQNLSHDHAAKADEVAGHQHPVWSEMAGQHEHPLRDPGHGHRVHGQDPGYPGIVTDSAVLIRDRQGNSPSDIDVTRSATGITIGQAGEHFHIIKMGYAGGHVPVVHIERSGGNEARPRNVALLALIRAY